MKLWGCRDLDGTNNLVRSDTEPTRNYDGTFDLNVISRADRVASLACFDVARGCCRELKVLNLWNWYVEYVQKPPTLKEAWKAYRTRELKRLSSYCDPARELVEALQREFPDE